MFNRFWLGSLALLVLLSSGCNIPMSKHPLVDPHEAISYPELYGMYRSEPPKESKEGTSLYHIGPGGEGYPPGVMRMIHVKFNGDVLHAQNMLFFVEKVEDAYIAHFPESGDKYHGGPRDSEATRWKPWNEGWGPWMEDWDGDQVDSYLLMRFVLRDDKWYGAMMDSDFLGAEIEAGRLSGEVKRREDEETAEITSVYITAETPELRAFFERHAAGNLFAESENPGHYVRLKSGSD